MEDARANGPERPWLILNVRQKSIIKFDCSCVFLKITKAAMSPS
jgi:hypothetical protein